jgi:hypothetical protein
VSDQSAREQQCGDEQIEDRSQIAAAPIGSFTGTLAAQSALP